MDYEMIEAIFKVDALWFIIIESNVIMYSLPSQTIGKKNSKNTLKEKEVKDKEKDSHALMLE